MKKKDWIYYGTMGLIGVIIAALFILAYMAAGWLLATLWNYALAPLGLPTLNTLQATAIMVIKHIYIDTSISYGKPPKEPKQPDNEFPRYHTKGNA